MGNIQNEIQFYENKIEALKQKQSGLDRSRDYMIGKILVLGNALILCKEIVNVESPNTFTLKGIYVNKKTLNVNTGFELTYLEKVTPLYYSKRSNKEEQEWHDDFISTLKKCFENLIKKYE